MDSQRVLEKLQEIKDLRDSVEKAKETQKEIAIVEPSEFDLKLAELKKVDIRSLTDFDSHVKAVFEMPDMYVSLYLKYIMDDVYIYREKYDVESDDEKILDFMRRPEFKTILKEIYNEVKE